MRPSSRVRASLASRLVGRDEHQPMIGFLDCYSGISGDMFLEAILYAGPRRAELSTMEPAESE
jgi:hypothetical protein